MILLDVVLGYRLARRSRPGCWSRTTLIRKKPVIASVTGTEDDPQVCSRQVATLRAAGVVVAPSNAHAAELAASLVS